jgi:septation ring formation regulator EzrA
MSTTAEIIAKLEAEAFDAEETARVWGFESDTAPPLRDAASRLSELERENARLRDVLERISQWKPKSAILESECELMQSIARAALAGSGEK